MGSPVVRQVCLHSFFRASDSSRVLADACNSSQSAFGVNIAGEYSNGFNDCGFWLRGPGNDGVQKNPDCAFWGDYTNWNGTVKEGLKNFALASMDALMYPFFWTWKVSRVLRFHLWSPFGSIVSLSLFRSAFLHSRLHRSGCHDTSTSVNCCLPHST